MDVSEKKLSECMITRDPTKCAQCPEKINCIYCLDNCTDCEHWGMCKHQD